MLYFNYTSKGNIMKQYLIYNNTDLLIGQKNTIFSILNHHFNKVIQEKIKYLAKAESYLFLAQQAVTDEYDPFEDPDETESFFQLYEYNNVTYLKPYQEYIVEKQIKIIDDHNIKAYTTYCFNNKSEPLNKLYFYLSTNEIFVYRNADKNFNVKYLKTNNKNIQILEHIKGSFNEKEMLIQLETLLDRFLPQKEYN